MPLNSVSNPVLTILSSFYNVESFIPVCVSMLKAQTISNFNVILVDDGSKDNSYQKCLEAVAGDPRFTVIRHEKNRGLGAGRITGIENCRTPYLTYVDPDDYLEPDAVETYLNDIASTGADYIVYDYFMSDGNSKKLITDNCLSADELFISKSPLISHVWHKVVRTALYKRFDYSFLLKVSFSEDLFNSINCFLNAGKISLIHRAYYTYMYNGNSLVHKRSEKSIWENILVNENLLNNKKLQDNKYIKKYIEEDCFYAFGQLIFPNLRNDFQRKPYFSKWREIFSEYKVPVPENASFFVRIYIWAIRHKIDFFAYLMWKIFYIKAKKTISICQ